MQQSNAAAATALYDHTGGGSLHNAGPASDAGDAVMARWLQSAGLQHLASPLASTGIDHRLLPNLLMQVIISLFLKPILRVMYGICL
jgi:kinesin family protein 2/24